MEKLDGALCEWIELYTSHFIYFNIHFHFSYLHTFYKPNNIKTKPSTKVKTYVQIKHNKRIDKCPTLNPHGT